MYKHTQYSFDWDSAHIGLPWRLSGKESACNAGDSFDVWIRKIPWRRKWQPTPVFLPGEFHGPRSLADYSLGSQQSQIKCSD